MSEEELDERVEEMMADLQSALVKTVGCPACAWFDDKVETHEDGLICRPFALPGLQQHIKTGGSDA